MKMLCSKPVIELRQFVYSRFFRQFKKRLFLLQLEPVLQNRVYLYCSSSSITKHKLSSAVQNELENKYFYQSLQHTFENGVLFDDLNKTDLNAVSEKFNLKCLDTQYLHKYGVKVVSDLNTLLFPLETLEKDFVAIQTVTYKKDVVGERIVQNSSTSSENEVLFGWSLIGQNQRELILTSNPLDAISVNQETDIPALSVPHDFQTFTSQFLNHLKRFHRIVFWLKSDLHSWKIHKVLSNSLGKSVHFIRPRDFPTALSCLQSGVRLKNVLRSAHPVYDEDLETFESYIDIIHDEFKGHERNSGLKWKRFSVLNDLLKGHRQGELTIFSGQTGTGKTTFVSEYSLDLCVQGLPTLWASFEITNTKLLKTMLTQYSRCSLVDNIDQYAFWSEEFLKIPMFFLSCHGAKTLKRILKAMANAVIVYNIQHVIVDNLQFMMNMEDYNSSLDQLRRQDQIFGAFREFSTHWNCHVTLVMHPRKEPEFTELSNTSISGTAKATQEADNILILQTTKARQYLQVTKNRFDGHKGCVVVEFDKPSQTFSIHKMGSKTKEQSIL